MTTFTTRKPVDANLPIQTVPDSHHSCRLCANGCRSYDVMLTEQEARRLSLDWWRDLLEDVPDDVPLVLVDPATGHYMLNKVNNRCVFLGSDNLCIIHKESGMTVKPTACQFFPLQAVQTPTGMQVSLNVGCRRLIEMGASDAPLDTSEAVRLLGEVQSIITIPETVPLTPDRDITFDELQALCEQFAEFFTQDLPFFIRVSNAAHFLLGMQDTSPADQPRILFRDLQRLITNALAVRPTLAKTYAEAAQILPTVIAAPTLLTEISAEYQRYMVEVARQHLLGYQFASHRTVRTGFVALLAAFAYTMVSGRTETAHAFNETLSGAIDLFLSPIGALALTEPAQNAFLEEIAIYQS